MNHAFLKVFKNKIPDTLLRFILIGSTLFSNKLVLILIAYFFNDIQYNAFNKAYYTASIIILFGTLGFDFAINRINVAIRTVTLGVIINITASLSVLYLLNEPFDNYSQVVAIFFYSLFSSLGAIYTFQHLFHGRVKNYVILMLLSGVLHLMIIPFVLLLEYDIYLLLPIVAAVWFLVGLRGFIFHNKESGEKLVSLYKLGITTFIINSAVSLALVADKYFVNHYFPIETANAYTFSWGLIVPMLYIGNVIERLIYSSTSHQPVAVFKKVLFIIFLLISLYSIVLIAVVNLFPAVLPGSINVSQLVQIISFMIWGYAIFVILNFPVNGYLFKFAETTKQKIIAGAYLTVAFLFIILWWLMGDTIKVMDYKLLLLLIWAFIFSLLVSKSVFTFFPIFNSKS